MSLETIFEQLQLDLNKEKFSLPTSLKEAQEFYFTRGFDCLWIGDAYRHEPHKASNHNARVVAEVIKTGKSKPTKKFFQLFLPMRQRRMMEVGYVQFPFIFQADTLNVSAKNRKFLPKDHTSFFDFESYVAQSNYDSTVTLDSVAVETGKTHYTMQFYFTVRMNKNQDEGQINLYSSKNTIVRNMAQFRIVKSDFFFSLDNKETFVMTNVNSTTPKKHVLNSAVTKEMSFLYLLTIFFPKLFNQLKAYFSSDIRSGRQAQYLDDITRLIFFTHYCMVTSCNDLDLKDHFIVKDVEGGDVIASKFITDSVENTWKWAMPNTSYLHHVLGHYYLASKTDTKNNYLNDIFKSPVIPVNIVRNLFNFDIMTFRTVETTQRVIDQFKDQYNLNLSLHQFVTHLASIHATLAVPKWAVNQTIALCDTGAIKMSFTQSQEVKKTFYTLNTQSWFATDAEMVKFQYVSPYTHFEVVIRTLLSFYSFVHQYHSHELEKVEDMYPSNAVADYILASVSKLNGGTDLSGDGFPLTAWFTLVNTTPHYFSHQKLRRFFFQMFCLDRQTAIDTHCTGRILTDFCSMAKNVKATIDRLTQTNGEQEEYNYSRIINWRNCPDLKIAHDEMSRGQQRLRYPVIKCNNEYYKELDGFSLEVPGTTLKVVFAPDTTVVREWGATQRHCIGNYADYINKPDYIVYGVWDESGNKWWGHCIDYVHGFKGANAATYMNNNARFTVEGTKVHFTAWQFYGYGNSGLPEEEKKLVREFVLDLLFVQKPAKLAELKKQLENTTLEEPVASNDEVSTSAVSGGSQLIAT